MEEERQEEEALLRRPDDQAWSPDTHAPGAPTPWAAWPALALSVCAVSSAGAVFRSLVYAGVPPVLLASWRLQATSLVLLPGFLWQLFGMPPGERARLAGKDPVGGRPPPLLQTPLALLAASGTCLAVHFGSWVWGIAHTTLPHSLLFVSSTPVLIAAGMLALRMPIKVGEVIGTALGVVGAGLIVAGAAAAEEGHGAAEHATLAGDASSLLGAAAMIGYLCVGRRLRSWVPLCVYALPVTLLASMWLALWAWAVELGGVGGEDAAAGSHGVFGWFHTRWAGRVAYLALGPGIMGHTCFNLLLRWVNPLVITLALNLEPILGSVAGWSAGLSGRAPGTTWAGGALLLLATSLVSVAAARREEAGAPGGGGGGVETPGSTPSGTPHRVGIKLRPVLDLFFSPATRKWAQERAVAIEIPGRTPGSSSSSVAEPGLTLGTPGRRHRGVAAGGGRQPVARRKILGGDEDLDVERGSGPGDPEVAAPPLPATAQSPLPVSSFG